MAIAGILSCDTNGSSRFKPTGIQENILAKVWSASLVGTDALKVGVEVEKILHLHSFRRISI
jgi:hypothetical protein